MKPILLIDNYDSFTYMLADYLCMAGANILVMRNDDPNLMHKKPEDFEALVISPGPGRPEDAGYLMRLLPDFIEQIPVLGVCLGHQAIGIYYGAKLVKAGLPRHGKVDEIHHRGNYLFDGVASPFPATRYHSLILEEIPQSLEVICTCGGVVMGLKHKHQPVYGLQFHPESCCTPDGHLLLRNFIEIARKGTE